MHKWNEMTLTVRNRLLKQWSTLPKKKEGMPQLNFQGKEKSFVALRIFNRWQKLSSIPWQNKATHSLSGDVGDSETCPVQNKYHSSFKVSLGSHFVKICLRKTVFVRKPVYQVGCFKPYLFFVITLFLLPYSATKHENNYSHKICILKLIF